jgi:UDP-N-acetylmuramoyl-L-alanyl-D-glutamate--2,6-diaminopimelate ligase
MGEAVAALADIAIVTSDNPRSEPPEAIIADITRGMSSRTTRVEVELDRHEAIAHAIRAATDKDIVLIAGKGHEALQLINGQELVLDDRKVAASILASLTHFRDR